MEAPISCAHARGQTGRLLLPGWPLAVPSCHRQGREPGSLQGSQQVPTMLFILFYVLCVCFLCFWSFEVVFFPSRIGCKVKCSMVHPRVECRSCWLSFGVLGVGGQSLSGVSDTILGNMGPRICFHIEPLRIPHNSAIFGAFGSVYTCTYMICIHL